MAAAGTWDLKRQHAKWLNMKTFSTNCNEEKTALFAHQESSYSAKKSHFLVIKCHGQVIKEQSYRFGTSDVQAFCMENKIQDFFFVCLAFFETQRR
jgi:hypothetical protein